MERHKGFVGLFDVLGFESLIRRESHFDQLERYESCVTRLSAEIDDKRVQYVLFSDSIVLTTPGDDTESLRAICRASSQLFYLLLSNGFPVRGAISLGSYSRSETSSGTFVAGRAIIDAYHFEKIQDWIGIILSTTVLHQYEILACDCDLGSMLDCTGKERDEKLGLALFLQQCGRIPFQSDHPVVANWEGFAIVPTYGSNATWRNIVNSLTEIYECLLRLKSLAPDPKSQMKYQRTREWLGSVLTNWRTLAEELRKRDTQR
jgi:hypothetical protein